MVQRDAWRLADKPFVASQRLQKSIAGGGSSAVSMPNVCVFFPPENAVFKSRLIATVAFRALTISPAMRGGRGVVGISVRRDEVSPPSSLQVAAAVLLLVLCTPSSEHPTPFSTDQVVLTS